MDKRYQVFVSSTYDDLVDERKEATQAILKCNCFPAGMELFPASNKNQWSVIKQVIDDSDFYLLIIAGRYGSLGIDDAGNKIGYTEMEFDYALSQKKPIIVMLHRHPETLPSKLSERTGASIKRLEKFRNKAMSDRMVAFWENKDQLYGGILSSLHKMMASTPDAVGWVRANTIPSTDEKKDLNLSQIIAEFKVISNAEYRIDYLKKLKKESLNECFSNRTFLEEFTALIDIDQPDDIICSAISLIPDYALGYEPKKFLVSKIDIDALFYKQCKSGKIIDSKLSRSIIWLLELFKQYSSKYAIPVLNYLKAGNFSEVQKKAAIQYVGHVGRCQCYNRDQSEWKSLLNYIKNELTNPNRVLSILDLVSLLVSACGDENTFVEVYNIFIDSNRSVQQIIIDNIFEYCGADLQIVTPRIQRMFFDMCERVYLWNNDKITADLLLFCLFTRTYDIYTADEVFNKLDDFNDDVFYLFFWNLGFGEFGRGTEESYNLDDEEMSHIIQIIEKRKHSREKKLIEHLH